MTAPFDRDGDLAVLRLQSIERVVLATVPALLDTNDDADGRLDYTAHPDDGDAEARYRDLVAGDLETLRLEDRTAFESVAAGVPSPHEDVAAFMRVVGEARLVLAARLGIEHDGWEYDTSPDDPEMALLGWLGWLQEAAVRLLSESL